MGAVAGAVSSVATKAIDTITGSLSDAVSRFDTLQNFPKIMANLGYSSEDASRAIKGLSDGAKGLPVSLDSLATTTKLLTPLAGGLDKAKNLTLALSDAFMASGSSSEDAQRGLREYTEMLADGQVDARRWRTLLQTMSPVLQQVAKSFGITSGSTQELYDALKKGDISFDQFNERLVSMDKAGQAGFKSLHDQAKDATGGIGTSFENLKNSVTRNLANLIGDVNSKFNISVAINNISAGIDTATKGFEGLFSTIDNSTAFDIITDNVNGFVGVVDSDIENAISTISGAFDSLDPLSESDFGAIGNIISDVFSIATNVISTFITLTSNSIAGLFSALSQVANGIDWSVIQTAFDNINTAVSQITGFFTDISNKVLDWVENSQVAHDLFSDISSFINDIADILGNVASTVGQFFQGIGETIDIQGILDNIGGALNNLWGQISPFIDSIKGFIQWFKDSGIAEFIGQVIGNAFNVLGNIVGGVINVIAGIVSTVRFVGGVVSSVFEGIANAVSGLFEGIVNTIKSIINGIIDIINGVLGAINGMINTINNIPGVNIPNIPNIPHLARGGVVGSATPFIAGEAGSEAIIPLERSSVIDQFANKISQALAFPNEITLLDQDGSILSKCRVLARQETRLAIA